MRAEHYENKNHRQDKKPAANAVKPLILLAEDDQEMRTMLKRILIGKGYDVETCIDGFELLQHFGSFSSEKLPRQFDLIVSDIRMPGFTGMEILDFVHDNGGFPPIMLITAFGNERTHLDAKRLGAAAILDKPFDIDDFLSSIGEILEKKQAGLLKTWHNSMNPADLSLGFPLEIVSHNFPELEAAKDYIIDGATSLKSLKVKIIYCRVIFSKRHKLYENDYSAIRIILTVPGKVLLVENNPYEHDQYSDLRSAITEMFEILHGRLEKYLADVRDGNITLE
jgi:CheY-like chemotaxis protein